MSVPLIDVQNSSDTRGIALQRVGVKQVMLPLVIAQKNGQPQTVTATIQMNANLSASDKGTHLSRFMIQLAESSAERSFCYKLDDFLLDTCQRLGATQANIEIAFPYFIQKPAPVSGLAAPMAYPCQFSASLQSPSTYAFVLSVEVPVTTLCPCSKAISDYGAHNQRAALRAQLRLDMSPNSKTVWIEDIIQTLEACASCAVYPILKRTDEKFVTEYAYDHPRFVEDVIRDAILALRQTPGVLGFTLDVEAFESIHAHNAWAWHHEGLETAIEQLV